MIYRILRFDRFGKYIGRKLLHDTDTERPACPVGFFIKTYRVMMHDQDLPWGFRFHKVACMIKQGVQCQLFFKQLVLHYRKVIRIFEIVPHIFINKAQRSEGKNHFDPGDIRVIVVSVAGRLDKRRGKQTGGFHAPDGVFAYAEALGDCPY